MITDHENAMVEMQLWKCNDDNDDVNDDDGGNDEFEALEREENFKEQVVMVMEME